MSTHTPTPWKTHDATALTIWSADGHCVADCSPGRDYANGMTVSLHNAAHICKCVNSHDALLAACKAAEEAMCQATFYMRGKNCGDLNYAIDKVRAVLKSLAEGQG